MALTELKYFNKLPVSALPSDTESWIDSRQAKFVYVTKNRKYIYWWKFDYRSPFVLRYSLPLNHGVYRPSLIGHVS